jgi:hypothetical protein
MKKFNLLIGAIVSGLVAGSTINLTKVQADHHDKAKAEGKDHAGAKNKKHDKKDKKTAKAATPAADATAAAPADTTMPTEPAKTEENK